MKNAIMEQSAQVAVQELVEVAKKKRMMADNITVILVNLNRGIEPIDGSVVPSEDMKC